MNYNNLHINPYISFKKWSRKGYAIFASLGIQVRISFLNICMCMLDYFSCIKDYIIVNNIDLSYDIGEHTLCMQTKIDLGDNMGLQNSYL